MKRGGPLERSTELRTSSSLRSSGNLPRRSAKRASQERTYLKRRRLFLQEWPQCQHPDACGNAATDVHHMQGRVGALLLDESKWIALCRPHHDHVGAWPALAIAQGVSYPRVGVA